MSYSFFPIGGLAGIIEGIGTDVIGPVLIYNTDIIGDYYVGGLAGEVEQSAISMVGVEGVDITGDDNVGGFIGRGAGSITFNSHVSNGDIEKLDTDEDEVAGIIGDTERDALTCVYTSVDIDNSRNEQGLVGRWAKESEKPTILLSYYNSSKTISRRFTGVRGKTTGEIRRGVQSPLTLDMDTIYNGWNDTAWDFRATSQPFSRASALER